MPDDEQNASATDLEALVGERLERAGSSHSRRAARTVSGDHATLVRQTVVALLDGERWPPRIERAPPTHCGRSARRQRR